MNIQEEAPHATVAISSRQRTILSQILQDLRQTLSHMRLPRVTPLSALDATAIDALKDLYYMVNTEDPLNTMPIRRHILQTDIITSLLIPLLSLLHSDPAAKTNPKRWSVPIYHSLRLFAVLTSPVLRDNGLLPPASSLDDSLLNLRAKLAEAEPMIDAYVALLQYYLDRKARKAAALAAAEESKLEDARIDNILRFFRNLLSPPRTSAGKHLQTADRGVHFAVVKALVKTDFYSTLSILFASKEDARGHYTDLVFLTGEIYALTFRHCTPKELFRAHRQTVSERASALRQNVPAVQPEIRKRRTAGLRSVLRSERATMGGSHAPRTSARWTNRHSGGFTAAPKPGTNPTFKKIMPTRDAIEANLTFNSRRPLQEAVQVNSDILCMLIAKGRPKGSHVRKKAVAAVRQDVTDEGLAAIVSLATELVEVCFEYLVRELRERIEETKNRSKADETDTLMTAQKSFVGIIGAIVGFHRERYGKIRRDHTESQASLNAELHRNCMRAVLSSDFKIVKNEWKAVEAGVELDSFQLVFRVLVESCESLREDGKDDEKVAVVELSTSAVLEMMKMLQGMTAKTQDDEDRLIDDDMDKKLVLTPREIALNTIEKLFERQSFLNAPAELAKDFNNKMFSFKHLTNIVEVAHAFTTILLDEQELAMLQVTKVKRNKRKKEKEAEEKNTEDDDPEFRIGQITKEKGEANPDSNEAGQEDQAKRAKKKNKVVESDEEGEESAKPQEATSPSDKGTQKDAEESRPPPAENRSDGEAARETNEEPSESAPKEHVDGSENTIHKRDVQDLLLADANDEDENVHSAAASSTPSSEKLSNVQQLLLADSENARKEEASQKESSSEGVKSKEQSETQPISKVQLMLMADREQEPEKPKEVETPEVEKPDMSKLTTVQNMLLADADLEGKETEMPKLVSTIEEMRREAIRANAKAAKEAEDGRNAKDDAGSDESDNSDDEPELREVESVGIIRRFAHAKALQTLILPIRAALCKAPSLTGTAFPIPEGSNPLLSPVVIAKSAHVLAAVWRVAKVKERGVQCGQFFSYSTMHLMNIALSTSSQSIVKKDSVLERLSVFARDVTKEFFTWLTFNPGLSLDLFFPMDKNSCNMYVSHIRPKALDSHHNADEDSGNESDLSLLDIEKRVDDAAAIGSEKPRTGSRSRNATSRAGKRRMRERRRVEREKIVEDEDVDDIDNLDLGIDIDVAEKSEGDSPKKAGKSAMEVELPDDFIEDSPLAPRARKAKRARKRIFDPFDSDDEVLESRMRKKRAVKAKKVAKKVKETAAKKARGSKKPTFSSSDEYSDIEIESGMELSDVEKDKGSSEPPEPEDAGDASGRTERNSGASERPPRRLKTKLNFSESPDMLDEEEEDGGDEDEPLDELRKSPPPLKSKRKPDTRVLATKVPDSSSGARLSTQEVEDDDSSAESDAKTSAGIPTPSSEKSKGGPPGKLSKDDREPFTPESGSSPLHSKQPHSQRRSDRKPRRVVCSDEESE